MPQETRRKAIKVLLVDDDQDDYMLTRDALKKAAGVRFELDWSTCRTSTSSPRR